MLGNILSFRHSYHTFLLVNHSYKPSPIPIKVNFLVAILRKNKENNANFARFHKFSHFRFPNRIPNVIIDLSGGGGKIGFLRVYVRDAS